MSSYAKRLAPGLVACLGIMCPLLLLSELEGDAGRLDKKTITAEPQQARVLLRAPAELLLELQAGDLEVRSADTEMQVPSQLLLHLQADEPPNILPILK